MQMTWRQAATWRVRRHFLDRRAPEGSLLSVTSHLCGLHAQVLSCSELTAWARVEGLEHQAVQRALWEKRSLVKTWAMRGTLHLLPAAELPLWHAALSTSGRYLRSAAWTKYFGVSLEELDQITEAVGQALEGRVLTREELMAEVCRLTGSDGLGKKVAEGSWGTILKPAAFRGLLCFGSSVGQKVRFTRPHTWVDLGDPMEVPAATAEVTRRFLAVYGPATVHDLARWWGGGSVAAARRWIVNLGDEVTAVDLEGTQAWMLAADVKDASSIEAARSVRLLPGFDQYTVAASHHAAHLLPGEVLRSRVYRPQGWISPVLLVNGYMEGTWRHEIKGSRVEIGLHPFGRLPAWVRRAAREEAERLAEYFGLVCAFSEQNH